ncbi:ATP-binding cassette domain-containing protein [Cutibacterium equinum]|uniref:ATP-binding cassette domain-containing protein n=1 Tax=Cutibacterium equinum TaxID=3016342 RepID=A0ABY7QYC3_9ACTN|nr:ATP-binding cassette domain-containing protein [Cutibacterium equinum]WCC80020.1 ATP-binding cassette domain-containing protein [Cutibacterium equinum]
MKGIMSEHNRPYESDEPWQPSHAAPSEPGSFTPPRHGGPSEHSAPSQWAAPSPQPAEQQGGQPGQPWGHPQSPDPQSAQAAGAFPAQAAPAQPSHAANPARPDGLAPGLLDTPFETDAAAGIDLTKIYGDGQTRVTALDSVHVRFTRGTFTAIMGPSGSGKSTLMHCLAGLDRITSGRVFLAGQEISGLPDSKLTTLRRDNVGFIFQSFNLLPMLTAEENIRLPLDLAGRKPDKALWDQLVTGLGIADRLKHRPSELSGGQQQRVACARAMITKPHVVFADEPTGALDSKSGANLLTYLRHCVDDLGQTIIMVTHDAKAASYADRALMLLDGRIVDDITSPTAEAVNEAMAGLEG